MTLFSTITKQKNRLTKAGLAGAFAIGGALIAQPISAQPVKEMTYRNDGNYLAQFSVQWMTPSGDVCGGGPAYQTTLTQKMKSVTIDLTGAFKIDPVLSDTPYCADVALSQGRLTIAPGSTVWGMIIVGRNKYKTCKSVSRNVTFAPSGREIVYFSEGTETSGNQCQRD
ncbi:MAG: hypothetical protein AAFV37_00960 [Pseudomonadota bacterium]